jgi:hypothetical protein
MTRTRPRPCDWVAIVRRLVLVPAIGKNRVVDGPKVVMRRAWPGSGRRQVD